MATTAITELTPMRMPSTVRKERSLLARSDCRAMAMASEKGMALPGVALDLAVPDAQGPVRVGRDVGLVGDQDDGVALGVQPLEEPHDLLAGLGIEVPRGLVGEEDRGLHDEGSGDGHPLALPARELARPVGDPRPEVHHVEGAPGDGQPLFLGHPGVDERQLHVVERGGAGQQVEGLEDEADLAVAHRGQLVVVHLRDHLAAQHVGAPAGGVEAAHDVHEGGLAGAGGAHHRHVLAPIDGEGDPAQGVDLLPAHDVRAPEVLGPDEGALGRGLHRGRAHDFFLLLSSTLMRASALRVRRVL